MAELAAFAVANAGAISAATTIASMGMQLVGSMQQANAQQAAAGAAAQAAQANATNAEFQAKQLENKGKWEFAAQAAKAQQDVRRKRHLQSKMQAQQAASGFDATDVTALHQLGEVETYGTMQQQMTMAGGGMAYNDAATGAAVQRYNADAYRTEASNQIAGGKAAATGTIIGGIGGALSSVGGLVTQQYRYAQASKQAAGPATGGQFSFGYY